MKFRSKFAAIVGSAVLIAALAACSTGTSTGTKTAAPGHAKLTIGLVMLEADPYFQGISTTLSADVKADGGTVIATTSNNDAGTEATNVQNLISRHVDAIVMQPVDDVASLATMKLVTAAHIPLICYGNCLGGPASPSVVEGVVQSDNTALGTGTGVLAAKYIKAKLGGSANIGILNCDVASACKLRKAGFKKALSDAGVKATYIADQAGYIADAATTTGTNMISANPSIDLIWTSNDGGTEGGVVAVQQSGKKIVVFGTDIATQIAGYLLDPKDILQATTGQDSHGTANTAYKMAQNAVAKKKNVPFDVELPGVTYDRADTAPINAFIAANPSN